MNIAPLHPRRSIARRTAFTLIEIILVLTIISILMGAVIYMVSGNLDDAREIRVKGDIQSLTTSIKRYEMSNLNAPSTEQGLQALVTAPTGSPRPRSWRQLLPTVPEDPWGMPYQYSNPGRHNPNGFDLYSFGPDKKESDDDIGNWQKGG
ncbi:MAG TPA: type II secretion system major pseudopilin GspG [Chthoniobacterales bacterium]